MKRSSSEGISGRQVLTRAVWSLALIGGAMGATSCASTAGGGMTPRPPIPTKASTTDPRVGLRGGLTDAAVAIKALRLVSHVGKPPLLEGEGGARGLTYANSDLAFAGNYVYQGNFAGFQIWDIANPASPVLKKAVLCGTGQGDPSIYGNLLFLSSEGTGNRTDCGMQGVSERVSTDRMVGVRIYDISDIANPRKVADVQTCRGSHTHTLVPDPVDKSVVYVYVSGSAGVRAGEELAGCQDGPVDDANSARFRIEVIRVPLAHPEEARVVNYAHIFGGLGPVSAHGAADQRPGPNQCHDITVYPAIGLAGGACGGYGLLMDIRDPVNPKRLQAVGDTNFAFWHSATFNNDGTKVLFTDEWGGGTQAKCRFDDPIDWGADAIFTLRDGRLTQAAYFKMPAAQTREENCVAHNGSLVPVPGRDLMAQGWYQGGLDVIDFTDANHPYEVAYFDRGPVDSAHMVTAGHWAAYWYNGHIIASEIARGLDILELVPNEYLSQNEIDAAKLVRFDTFNPQLQPKIVWPAAFPVVRSYLDQLVRGGGLSVSRTSAIGAQLAAAEALSGSARRAALTSLAAQVDGDVAGASDGARVRAMAAAIRDLAKGSM